MSSDLTVWDYVVFGLMVTSSVCIGIYYAVKTRRNQNTTNYFAASHSMTFLPVALSLMATYESSIMMLGIPAEGFVYGIPFALGQLSFGIGFLLDIFLTLNFIWRLKLSSPYEYLEKRFESRHLRLMGNIACCVSHVLYLSVVLYGQAIALQAVTGFSVSGSIWTTTLAAVIYTAIGGLKAVIWTDVLQFCIMCTGILAVIFKGMFEIGGPGSVWGPVSATGRLNVDFDPDPSVRHTFWNLCFGHVLTGFGVLFRPATLQRISATKSISHARGAVVSTAIGIPTMTCTALMEGIVAFAYYSYVRCDPLASKQINNPNKLVPFFILDLFRNIPGLPGLFLAALFSASLSTASSILSALSSVTWYDVIKPCKPNMSEFLSLLVAKATVVLYGLVCGILAVLVSKAQTQTLSQIMHSLNATVYIPMMTIFYLGALIPSANRKGAICGLLTGIGFMGWVVIGAMTSSGGKGSHFLPSAPVDQCPDYNFTTVSTDMNRQITPNATVEDKHYQTGSRLDVLYSLSYTLLGDLAIIVVFVVGILTSWATGGLKQRADPELVIHKTDIMCWCFQSSDERHDSYKLTAVEAHVDSDFSPSPEAQKECARIIDF